MTGEESLARAFDRAKTRFVENEAGCWVWQAYRTKSGYAGISWLRNRGPYLVHRLFYERLHGPIPGGLHLDHKCRNKLCVNPAHLEPVTNQENLRRGINPRSAKTACRQGHPYNLENTKWYQGRRYCRECHRIDNRRRKARLREEKASAGKIEEPGAENARPPRPRESE